MQEILDQIITPEVRMVLYLMVICVVMLYILSIIYVIRDAQRRGAEPWWMWAVISVVPIVGLLAYVILRPSSYLIDREEQDLDIALREHQLSHYGICPKCSAPIAVLVSSNVSMVLCVGLTETIKAATRSFLKAG